MPGVLLRAPEAPASSPDPPNATEVTVAGAGCQLMAAALITARQYASHGQSPWIDRHHPGFYDIPSRPVFTGEVALSILDIKTRASQEDTLGLWTVARPCAAAPVEVLIRPPGAFDHRYLIEILPERIPSQVHNYLSSIGFRARLSPTPSPGIVECPRIEIYVGNDNNIVYTARNMTIQHHLKLSASTWHQSLWTEWYIPVNLEATPHVAVQLGRAPIQVASLWAGQLALWTLHQLWPAAMAHRDNIAATGLRLYHLVLLCDIEDHGARQQDQGIRQDSSLEGVNRLAAQYLGVMWYDRFRSWVRWYFTPLWHRPATTSLPGIASRGSEWLSRSFPALDGDEELQSRRALYHRVLPKYEHMVDRIYELDGPAGQQPPSHEHSLAKHLSPNPFVPQARSTTDLSPF
ncbi:hypothetical protein JCM1840_005503 [Sporobolomyces johnsonii]